MTPFCEALLDETLDILHKNLRDMYEIDDVSWTPGDVDHFSIPVFFADTPMTPEQMLNRRPCDRFDFGRNYGESEEEARKWWQSNLKEFLRCYGKKPPKARRGKRTQSV